MALYLAELETIISWPGAQCRMDSNASQEASCSPGAALLVPTLCYFPPGEPPTNGTALTAALLQSALTLHSSLLFSSAFVAAAGSQPSLCLVLGAPPSPVPPAPPPPGSQGPVVPSSQAAAVPSGNDTAAPVIHLLGASSVEVQQLSTFVDAGGQIGLVSAAMALRALLCFHAHFRP